MTQVRRALALGAALAAAFALQGQSPPAPAPASRPDALLLYRQGRDLESSGRQTEAEAKYLEAIGVCDRELAQDPRRMDAYAVKCWSLFRLERHQEVVDLGAAALKLVFDPRIAEVMGESYYHLGKNELALRFLEKYIETVPENADRVATAYFYMAETYLRMKKFSHADIAYSLSVAKEPSMSRWWYRYGLACENLGEWKRSYEYYGRALALSPSLKEAIDGQARVKPKAGL